MRDRNAFRSVGTAIGQNEIGYLIPCHRVIRKTGIVGDYRWGAMRKQAIVAGKIARNSTEIGSVSYTHLTLPTKA